MPFGSGSAGDIVGEEPERGDGAGFDIDLYHAEGIDDELGEGFRMYTLNDTVHDEAGAGSAASGDTRPAGPVYEARRGTISVHDGGSLSVSHLDTRIYQDGEDWMLKANTPATEKKPAYHALRHFADTVEDVEGTELESTWLAYQTAYEDDDPFEVETVDRTVSFRHEGEIDVPTVSCNGFDGLNIGAGFGSAIGGGAALLANAVGMPVDPVSGVMLGWMTGAGVGGVGLKAYQFRTNGKRKRAYGEVEGMEELDLFDRMNEKNRLEAILDRPGPAPDRFTEQYNELREDEFEEIFDAVMMAHFDDFHEQAGVTLTGRFDTYTDAYGMAAELVGVEAASEQPSIYTDVDVFRHLFSFLTYEEDGAKHLLEDGEALVREVLRRDGVAPEITEWLDTEYAELVQDVGQKHSMEGCDV